MYRLVRRALFALEPERAHSVALSALQCGHRLRILPRLRDDPAAAVSLMGLDFPNRVGLAAGFDKNGRYIDALGSLGFGFIEVGTVTPRPQAGQPLPRLFRLLPSSFHPLGAGALINRMGFPNDGSSVIAARLAQRAFRGICGVNIGKNAETPLGAAIDDYVACYRAVAPYADYVAVNVSSPNTKDLRRLQQAEYLQPILESLIEEREVLRAKQSRPIPLLIKISPDLSEDELRAVAQLLMQVGVDGVIATNTTVSRSTLPVRERIASGDVSSFNLEAAGQSVAGDQSGSGGQLGGRSDGRAGGQSGGQSGGLSGAPLRPLALQAIRILRSALGRHVPIIGVGGIASGADALDALDAGADLVQVYTALIYRGPMLIREIRAAFKARSRIQGEDVRS